MTIPNAAQFHLNSLWGEITANPGADGRYGQGLHVSQIFASLGLTWLVLLGRRSFARVKPQSGSLVENSPTALASELSQDLGPSLPPSLSTWCIVCNLLWDEVQACQFCLDQRFESSGLLTNWLFDRIIFFIQTTRSQEHQSFTKSISGHLMGKHCFDQTEFSFQTSLQQARLLSK